MSNIRLGTPVGRGVLLATVIGSGMAYLDNLIVNLALPAMDRDLDLGVRGLQWTVSGYLLSLSALLLLGGALGDRYGRRRIYAIGIVVFVIASMACGLATSAPMLILARVIQGVGGALMVPASIAIIQSVFVPQDRSAAIGTWTGMSAVFTGLGPLVGGVFVTWVSWRAAFFVNLPLGIGALVLCFRCVPETSSSHSEGKKVDVAGALLVTVALAALVYGAVQGSVMIFLLGALTLVPFLLVEARAQAPLMPLSMFRGDRQFNWVNVCTVLFYGSFVSGVTFLGVRLQTGLGYSALESGLATLPVTVLMLLLSKHTGAFSARHGAKLPLTVGPILVAGALAWMSQIEPGREYWSFVLPAVITWGLGLSTVVAPLTAAALAAADQTRLGVASAINNAASRLGPALAIALLPAAVGIAGGELAGPAFDAGYARMLLIAGGGCLVAAAIAAARVSGASSEPDANGAG